MYEWITSCEKACHFRVSKLRARIPVTPSYRDVIPGGYISSRCSRTARSLDVSRGTLCSFAKHMGGRSMLLTGARYASGFDHRCPSFVYTDG